jgi:hypothetical protein
VYSQKPLVIRALELAADKHLFSNRALQMRLKQEGYTVREIVAHFAGRALRQQLKSIRRASQGLDADAAQSERSWTSPNKLRNSASGAP